jgi:hypothetical protein
VIYHRCQCGKREIWESGMPPKDCAGCDDCGTTYGRGPSEHKPRIPHDWTPRFNSRTGVHERNLCRRCLQVDRERAATGSTIADSDGDGGS